MEPRVNISLHSTTTPSYWNEMKKFSGTKSLGGLNFGYNFSACVKYFSVQSSVN